MSRHDLLEKILAAKYDLETDSADVKSAHLQTLYALLDEARTGTNVSRHELLAALHDRYVDYFRMRRQAEILGAVRRLQDKP